MFDYGCRRTWRENLTTRLTTRLKQVPWVSTHVENMMQHYCWHTEKISALDEAKDTFFGRQVRGA